MTLRLAHTAQSLVKCTVALGPEEGRSHSFFGGFLRWGKSVSKHLQVNSFLPKRFGYVRQESRSEVTPVSAIGAHAAPAGRAPGFPGEALSGGGQRNGKGPCGQPPAGGGGQSTVLGAAGGLGLWLVCGLHRPQGPDSPQRTEWAGVLHPPRNAARGSLTEPPWQKPLLQGQEDEGNPKPSYPNWVYPHK